MKPEKPSIWERLAEEDLYSTMLDMNYLYEDIEQQQKKRVFLTIGLFLFIFCLGYAYSPFYYLFSFIVAFLFYRSRYQYVKNKHKRWVFKRHLGFLIFSRKSVSLLLQNNGRQSLYSVLNKLIQRTNDEADRKLLQQLVSDMRDYPQKIEPFIQFAKVSSGTDMAELFMTTIYSFHQTTSDTDVIYELSKSSSEELMRAIDEIIDMKYDAFSKFPIRVGLATFVVFIAFAITYMLSMADIFRY